MTKVNFFLHCAKSIFLRNGGAFDIRDKLSEIEIRCGEHNVKEDNSAFPTQVTIGFEKDF